MKKLVFIHTTPDVIDRLNGELKKKFKDLSIENIMDDDLLDLVKKDKDKTLKRLNDLVKYAKGENKPEEIEIVITCTALSELSNKTNIKTMMLDSYLHKELIKYKKILLIGTTKSALTCTKQGIMNNVIEETPIIEELFVKGAREEAINGNKDTHDRMIKEELMKKLSNSNYGVIVLCQPSISHLKGEIKSQTGLKVFTGIDYFIENYKQN